MKKLTKFQVIQIHNMLIQETGGASGIRSEKINYYYDRLLYWQDNTDKLKLDWADFLLDDTRPNKEKLLSEKRKSKLQNS